MYHLPVLLEASIDGLAIQPNGTYVDVTFGGGGHSRAILERLGPEGRLFGFDQDEDARANIPDDDRFTFVPGNFRYLKRFLRLEGVRAVDGILADLGVSSHQFDTAERGFSYRFEADLDMRMNQAADINAADLIADRSIEELQHLFSRFGEVRNAKTLATRIVEQRAIRKIERVEDLIEAITPIIRGNRPRYLAQVFQALRMEVNDEVGALEDFLTDSKEVLAPAGRLVVISYHSIEDRLVKAFLKTGNIDGEVKKDFYGKIDRPFKIWTKRAVVASDEEIAQNPRSRSAKLRIAERLGNEE
ncbi:MAG: 16S rRNA (cytosine(1402)-N(4))-methyltransferase RsmH [Bacteroidota bacterium]